MSSYIFIVSAPSGAGKSSLLKAFLNFNMLRDDFVIAISNTTREPRIGEKHGTEYYFTSINSFEELLKKDGFIEHAKVLQNYYGISKNEIEKLLAMGKNIILEIDWQGAEKIRSIYKKERVKSIYILPPSLKELRHRLEFRNTDSKKIIDHRMKQAENEISHAKDYDYKLVNDNFDDTLEKLIKYFYTSIKS